MEIDKLLRHKVRDDEWLDINELYNNLNRLIGYFYGQEAYEAGNTIWQAEQLLKELTLEKAIRDHRQLRDLEEND